MNAQADYQRVVDLLAKQQLAPYVSYAARDRISGIHAENRDARVVVRVADGKVISGRTHLDIQSSSGGNGDVKDTNPISHPLFDPKCYRATSEQPTTYQGIAAVRFTLASRCDAHHDGAFSSLIADAASFRPLDASGTTHGDGDDAKIVTVTFDQRYAGFDGRWLPASIRIDITGSGFMFWLQEHVREVYSDYRFTNSATP